MWLQKIFSVIFLTLCVFCLSLCSPKNLNSQVFQKKYGKEVSKIKAERTPPKIIDKNAKLDFLPPEAVNSNDVENIFSRADSEQYYANVDAAEYGSTQPREFSPNGQDYAQGQNNSGAASDNMFEISYKTALSPPFRRSGFEFDLIHIPSQDFYGVRTAISEKEYLLAGKGSLQRSVDQINSQKSDEDVEMSEILIKEQKQLKRKQKMIKVFGRDAMELKVDKKKNEVKKSAETDSKKASNEAELKKNPADNAKISDQKTKDSKPEITKQEAIKPESPKT